MEQISDIAQMGNRAKEKERQRHFFQVQDKASVSWIRQKPILIELPCQP